MTIRKSYDAMIGPAEHNGNGNGHRKVKPGGTGALQDGLQDRSHQRETLTMIQRGLKEGWIKPVDLDPAFVASLPGMVADSIQRSQAACDERSLLRAIEVVQRFLEYNLRMAEAVDGVGHGSTDNRVVVVIQHAEVSRIAADD